MSASHCLKLGLRRIYFFKSLETKDKKEKDKIKSTLF